MLFFLAADVPNESIRWDEVRHLCAAPVTHEAKTDGRARLRQGIHHIVQAMALEVQLIRETLKHAEHPDRVCGAASAETSHKHSRDRRVPGLDRLVVSLLVRPPHHETSECLRPNNRFDALSIICVKRFEAHTG